MLWALAFWINVNNIFNSIFNKAIPNFHFHFLIFFFGVGRGELRNGDKLVDHAIMWAIFVLLNDSDSARARPASCPRNGARHCHRRDQSVLGGTVLVRKG